MPLSKPRFHLRWWRLYIWIRRHAWSVAAAIATLVAGLWLSELFTDPPTSRGQREVYPALVASLLALIVVLGFRMAEGGFPIVRRGRVGSDRFGGALVWIACFVAVIVTIEVRHFSDRYFGLKQQALCAELSVVAARDQSPSLRRAREAACADVE